MAERPDLTVCFNGSCPICRAEIEHYRQLAGEDAGIAWLDVAADPAAAERLGIGGEAGFRRLHSVDAAGRLHARPGGHFFRLSRSVGSCRRDQLFRLFPP